MGSVRSSINLISYTCSGSAFHNPNRALLKGLVGIFFFFCVPVAWLYWSLLIFVSSLYIGERKTKGACSVIWKRNKNVCALWCMAQLHSSKQDLQQRIFGGWVLAVQLSTIVLDTYRFYNREFYSVFKKKVKNKNNF